MTDWIRSNLRYIALFGTLFGIVAVTALLGFFDSRAFAEHVVGRFALHLPWGCMVAMLIYWVFYQADRRDGTLANWKVFYGLPIAAVLAIACNQEFGFPGDFRHAESWTHAVKSFGDIAGWLAGALIAGWYTYRVPETHPYRQQFLRWKERKA